MRSKDIIKIKFSSIALDVEVLTTPRKANTLIKRYLNIHRGYVKAEVKRIDSHNYKIYKGEIKGDRLSYPDFKYKAKISKLQLIY
jgi:hypothetical protein